MNQVVANRIVMVLGSVALVMLALGLSPDMAAGQEGPADPPGITVGPSGAGVPSVVCWVGPDPGNNGTQNFTAEYRIYLDGAEIDRTPFANAYSPDCTIPPLGGAGSSDYGTTHTFQVGAVDSSGGEVRSELLTQTWLPVDPCSTSSHCSLERLMQGIATMRTVVEAREGLSDDQVGCAQTRGETAVSTETDATGILVSVVDLVALDTTIAQCVADYPQPLPDFVAIANNQAGWVLVHGTKQWIGPDCRTDLAAAGASFSQVRWSSFGRLPVAQPFLSCAAIADLAGYAPRAELVSFSGSNAGWFLYGGTRQWVDPDCRTELELRGYVFPATPWPEFGSLPLAHQKAACVDADPQGPLRDIPSLLSGPK